MADVQVEHGHLRIANDLWEAWFRADMGRNELRVLGVIVRLSYGWGRPDTGDAASFKRLQSDSGLGSRAVSDGLRRLLQKGIVRRTHKGAENHSVSVYAPVKDFDSWSPAVLPESWSPELLPPVEALPQTEVLPPAEADLLPPVEAVTTSARGSVLKTREKQEENKNPPNPPAGGSQGELIPNSAEKGKKRSKPKASAAAVRLLALWAELAGASPKPGTPTEEKRLRRLDGYIKAHSEAEIEAVIRHIASTPWWRGKTPKNPKDLFRDGPHRFLNGAEEVDARVREAMGNRSVNGGAWTDSPEDYEVPTDGMEFIEFRGKQIQRHSNGGFLPRRNQIADPHFPWRAVLDEVAHERLSIPGADIYRPEPFHEALRQKCQFVLWGLGTDDKVSDDVQWAIDAALNDAREGVGR